MNFIRWILSNIILIIFVLALTYAYVYWDNLTGHDTPAGKVIAWLSDEFDMVREFVEDYEQKQAEATAEAVAEAPAAAAAEVVSAAPVFEPQAPVRAAPPPTAAAPPMPERSIITQPLPEHAVPPARPAPPVASRDMAPMPMRSRQFAPPPPPDLRPEPPVRPVEPVAAAPEPAPSASAEAGSHATPRETWVAARNAYRNGDYDAAIRNYERVITTTENNFDAWGELGNVHYRIRNYERAAEAYYEAARILIQQGKVRRVAGLLPLMARLDPEKSRQLQELIESTR